ncbi:MAG TPA: hypothetical protein ENJ82_06485, partial [Bacteroidetes bacterium]|nr:hypothetical protein [Bacteroidota bacterium]
MGKNSHAFWGLVFLLGFIFVFPSLGFSQQNQLDELQRKKRQMEKEIILLTQARDSSRIQKETSFAELQLLNRQVYLREQLLSTIRAEVKELAKQIEQTSSIISSLEEEIEAIKTEFGKLMVVTYKSLNNKSSAFYVFSSSSVSQGYKRAQYFRAISRMQQAQMKLIRKTKAFLARKKLELEQNKVRKQQVAIQERKEQKKLVLLKAEQKTYFTKMKADEARFEQGLQNSKKRLTALNKEIGKEIARIAAARKVKNEKNTKAENDVINKLTSNFSGNKGKFPWPMPMPNGTITRHFGKQTLPGSGIVVELQGIDISTLPGQAVRNIFAGTVETIMQIGRA